MSSRYDLSVLSGITLDAFTEAVAEWLEVGAPLDGPWQADPAVGVADFATEQTSGVVVVAPPERMPRGIDVAFVRWLGLTDAIFATVWDSVSTYHLLVYEDGVMRRLTIEPSADDDADEFDLYESGERLPEEPDGELDEAYVQEVISRRCGFDPVCMQARGWQWHALTQREGARPPRRRPLRGQGEDRR